MTPCQGGILHVTDRTDARRSPASQFGGERLSRIIRRGQSDSGNLVANFLGGLQGFGEVLDWFDVKKPVQTGELKLRVGLENNGPCRGILALPDTSLF